MYNIFNILKLLFIMNTFHVMYSNSLIVLYNTDLEFLILEIIWNHLLVISVSHFFPNPHYKLLANRDIVLLLHFQNSLHSDKQSEGTLMDY